MIGLFIFLLGISEQGQAADSRLQIDRVNECVEAAKSFIRSEEYHGTTKEQELIGACRDSDPDCVRAVGESLHRSDTDDKISFLTLIKSCRGNGMGKCFRDIAGTVPSYDRREPAQILKLLKKCE